MKRIRMLSLAILAVLAVAAVGASAASAAPHWQVAGATLGAGESKSQTSSNVTAFKLKAGSIITISCTTATSTGNIKGGTPGTDEAAITFSGCSVEGRTEAECHVNSPGQPTGTIFTEAKTELVYGGAKAEAEKEEGKLDDLFSPLSGTTFVEIQTAGTNCPGFEGTNKVTGSVAAEVSPTGEEKTTGQLIFPATSISKVYKWESAGKVKEVKPKLTVFGFIGCTQTGTTNVSLSPEEAFGAFA